MTRTTITARVLASMCLALVATGCSKAQPTVQATWPEAKTERVVPQPPVPARWPYTGLDAPDAAAILKRPLSIKIENSPSARPQLGLNSADVVYETITEGGITRFNCIFHSKLPKTVGPVRSARLSDMWIVPQYDGIFFFSGASSSVTRRVKGAHLTDLSQDAGVSRPYWRSSDRSAPHNLMLDPAKAYAEAKRRDVTVDRELQPLRFDSKTLEATPSVGVIEIPFSQANRVKWEWSADKGRYLRWNNGSAHRDAAANAQVSADNVVVMWVKYRAASRDMVGSTTYDVTLGGEGRVSVFRDGTRLDGTWTAKRTAPPKFTAKDGTPIRLATGRTWFQVIPLDGRIEMR